MRFLRIPCLFLLAVLSSLHVVSVHGQSPGGPELREGDRILFLGDTLLEREGNYGYLETRLHQIFPDIRFSSRNLSYSADTPHGLSRSVFDPADKGWERLKEQIAMVNPTVVVLGYGMASSLDFVGSPTDRMAEPKRSTEEKVTRFRKELLELMDFIEANAAANGGIAGNRSAGGVNDRASVNGTAVRGTPNAAEASAAATTGEVAIASSKPAPRDASGSNPGRGLVRFILLSPIAHEDLRTTSPALPDPAAHNEVLKAFDATLSQIATERGAAFVSLVQQPITANGRPVTTNGIHLSEAAYDLFARKVASTLWPAQSAKVDAIDPVLRTAVQRKNQQFFHRWRPQNQTYLFGFRKHEQGQNAKEIPMFDPIIEEGELAIDRLKRAAAGTRLAATVEPAATPGTEVAPLPLPKFDVQEGYEITLWASNPLLEKPIQMNWDSKGRLWVASSRTYPQITPGAQQEDRILILEDTDHDGMADKSTVFTEGLLIPTGVMPDARDLNGTRQDAYIAASTELLRMTDKDGDGKADGSEIVLSGFGTEDTHHILHTLRWSPDGRLYFNQSIYIHSHIETPWGVVRQNSGGVFAFDTRSQRLEVMYNGFWNPWGTAWDKYGQAFITDGAGSEAINWGIRGAAYQTYEGSRRLLQSISPGSYPKFAGLELIYSPHFPQDWQGSAVTCDFRAHRVVHFGIQDLATESTEGAEKKAATASGYITKELPDIVRTNDVSFRPIDVKLGPDGALYIADWSNPVINHGEVDFRDARRDRTHGRIWRVTKKDSPLAKWKAPGAGSHLSGTSSPNLWEQQWSRLQNAEDANVLADSTLPSLETARQSTITRPKFSVAFNDLTKSEDPNLRAAAAYLISIPGGNTNDLQRVLQELSKDSNPRVRLEAMRALTRRDPASADLDAVLRLATAAPQNDPFYDYAAWLAVNDIAEPWSAAVINGQWKINSAERETQLQFALNAIKPETAGQVLAKVVTERGLPKDGSGPWIELIGKSGGPKELALLYRALLAGVEGPAQGSLNGISPEWKLPPAAAARAAAALVEAARTRGLKPENPLGTASLGTPALLKGGQKEALVDVIRLYGYWKLDDLAAQIGEAITESPGVAKAGWEALRLMNGKPARAVVLSFLDPANSVTPAGTALRRGALTALASLDPAEALKRLPAVLAEGGSENELVAFWREAFAVKTFADQFAAKVPQNISPAATGAALRAAREQGRKAAGLVAALSSVAGTKPEATPAPQNYADTAALVKRDGSPAEGERIYRRTELGCVTCHAIGGAGGKVGPELTSIGASAPLDYIIESVVNPAAKVKEGFHAVNLTLKDGTVANGILARETAGDLVLRNAAGQETVVAKGNVAGKEDIGSLMPAGLTNALAPREQLHLYAFLGELGKPGIYDASKGTVARLWKLLPGSEMERALAPKADLTNAANAYTTVDGGLQKDALQTAISLLPSTGDTVVAVARFQLPAAGTTNLNLTGISKAWLDGKPLAVASEPKVAVDLPGGEHTIVVKLDPKQLPPVVKAESSEVRFLTE